MVAGAVRVLLTHQDPGVRQALRQALLGEPDIELLDPDGEPRTGAGDLAERVRVLHPDIILTDRVGDGGSESERILNVLQASPIPARIVLVNGRHPEPATRVPIDYRLAEDASRAEILRAVRLVQTPSAYLRYLPAIFSRDDFMGRFLRIFESVLDPVDRQIDHLEHYFDPDLVPNDFLPWLASWLDITLDDGWPRERKVALIRAAPELHRWRGTRRGLREQLRLYLGIEPEIEETAGGLRLGPSTQLGFRTTLGESGPRHHFTVTLRTPDHAALDFNHVAALIDAQKPAHCTYTLTILPSGSRRGARSRGAAPAAGAEREASSASETQSPEDV
jgi:phage tail-like protein